ncbi:MAG: formylglycine-generating enzyme family protein, partial [Polyangiaceae bacterium]
MPASLDGLEFCFNAGLTSGPGQIVPNCMGAVDSSTAVAVADGSRGDVSTSPHCQAEGDGLTNCGSASESCCTSVELAGGTYYRTYTNDGTGATGLADPASVSSFRLDKYDVTVGRFRQFVAAWTSGWAPQEGAGKHVHLNGGQGLANSGSPGAYETGWVTTDNGYVAPTDTNLGYCTPSSTWTSTASTQETLPIDCVNWYEAYAFCIWDGGFLPSEAEWEYAAAGGSQQREYPWGSTDPGTSSQYAIYGDSQNNCYYPTGSLATCGGVENNAPVGTAKLGAGLWGQVDLAGNVFQWNLDWYAAYVDPCTDCADMTSVLGEENARIHRGGACDFDRGSLLPPARFSYDPAQRT